MMSRARRLMSASSTSCFSVMEHPLPQAKTPRTRGFPAPAATLWCVGCHRHKRADANRGARLSRGDTRPGHRGGARSNGRHRDEQMKHRRLVGGDGSCRKAMRSPLLTSRWRSHTPATGSRRESLRHERFGVGEGRGAELARRSPRARSRASPATADTRSGTRSATSPAQSPCSTSQSGSMPSSCSWPSGHHVTQERFGRPGQRPQSNRIALMRIDKGDGSMGSGSCRYPRLRARPVGVERAFAVPRVRRPTAARCWHRILAGPRDTRRRLRRRYSPRRARGAGGGSGILQNAPLGFLRRALVGRGSSGDRCALVSPLANSWWR